MPQTVKLVEYLFTRLRQLGVESIHGVPGDYNLTMLDYVEPQGLHWVGNCNELNAGYAADGYARIKGVGALITTFGVGELSAANAIAGAYAELAPVVHIVGTPTRHQQESRAKIHHTFNDGEFRRFAQMHAMITVAQTDLKDPQTCAAQVDATLQQCIVHSRPVYIELPVDMVAVPVPAEPLQHEIQLPPVVPSLDQDEALTAVLDRIYNSERPMILVDGEIRAYNAVQEVHEFILTSKISTWVTSFGKGLVDESLPNFCRLWQGDAASKEDREFVQSRDLILCFGPHFSGTNTYMQSATPDPEKTILFRSTSIKTSDAVFQDLPGKIFLSTLLNKLEVTKLKPSAQQTIADGASESKQDMPPDGLITQKGFYLPFNSLLRSGDIVLGETGTAGYGVREFKLPPNTPLFKPVTWLSIGYMLPAAQGAALAQRELHVSGRWTLKEEKQSPRTILFIGDGSFQMTAQELSIIVREKLNVTVILLNNSGYTIERCLHGYKMHYNDIASWRYLQAPALFGANDSNHAEYPTHTFTVKTWGDLESVLRDERMTGGPALRMLEVFMDQDDAPAPLLPYLQLQKDAEQ